MDMGRIHRDSVDIEEMLLGRASLVHYSCLPPTMASEDKVRSEDIHTCSNCHSHTEEETQPDGIQADLDEANSWHKRYRSAAWMLYHIGVGRVREGGISC